MQFVAVSKAPTTTLVENGLIEQLKLPILTFCPDKGLKAKGFFYNPDDFEKNKYRLEDIFIVDDSYKNKNLKWTETWSVYKGACYSFEFFDLSTGYSLEQFQFYLQKTAPNLNLLIHEKGYEMWVVQFIFPLSIEVLNIEPETRPTILYMDIPLKKTEYLSVKNCKDENYDKCAKNGIIEAMKERGISCLTSYYWQFLDPKSQYFSICKGKDEANESYVKSAEAWADFIRQPVKYNCTRPCYKTTYSPHLIQIDKRAINKKDEPEGAILSVTYETMHVTKYTEHYLYDLSNVFSSIGGSMGLLLGLSIYPVLSLFTDAIFNLL